MRTISLNYESAATILAFVLLIAHTQFVTGFTQTGGAGGHKLPSMPIDNLELEASNNTCCCRSVWGSEDGNVKSNVLGILARP
jgi:hypothetical protein